MPQRRNTALQQRYGSAYKWLAGFAVVLGLLTTIFSSTMVNVALTDIMATFQITQGSAQWMSTAFLSASSVAMLTTAWLMNRIGARLTFLCAIASFILGSFLGWFSISFEMLVIARIFQGAGAGILQPLSMALVFLLFPPNMRGRAMGLFGMGVVMGPAFGPIIGGIITDSLEWHTTFSVVIPLALIAGGLGLFLLPDKEETSNPRSFNFISFFLIALTVGSLLTGLSRSQFFELTNLNVYPYLLIAITGFTLFLIRELKSAAPLVQLRMFKDLSLTSSALIGALTTAGMFSTFYTIPLFARTVQSSSATDAGMLLFPAGLLLVFVFPIVGRLIDKMPAYRLILFGQVLFVIASIAISFSTRDTSYMFLAGWIIVGRIGLGFVMPSNSTFALSIVTPAQVPDASGALNFVRMLGGTIGVNLTALLITARTAYHTRLATAAAPDGIINNDAHIQLLTDSFQDVFMVMAAAFSTSLILGLYMAWAHHTDQTKNKPRPD